MTQCAHAENKELFIGHVCSFINMLIVFPRSTVPLCSWGAVAVVVGVAAVGIGDGDLESALGTGAPQLRTGVEGAVRAVGTVGASRAALVFVAAHTCLSLQSLREITVI